jgi:hypothetical protein
MDIAAAVLLVVGFWDIVCVSLSGVVFGGRG